MLIYNIIVGIIAIICFLLIVVVLLQPGQGGGVSGMGGAGAIGGGGGGGLGARRTADLLSKSTSVLATLFLVLCVLANFAIDRGQPDRSILQEGAPGINAPIESPSQTVPAIPQQDQNGTEGNPDSEN